MAYKYDTHSSGYKKMALCSPQSALLSCAVFKSRTPETDLSSKGKLLSFFCQDNILSRRSILSCPTLLTKSGIRVINIVN